MQTAIAVIYCNYIAKGHTIYGLKVRLPTLKGYMKAMAEYTSMFCNRDVTNNPTAHSTKYVGKHTQKYLPSTKILRNGKVYPTDRIHYRSS